MAPRLRPGGTITASPSTRTSSCMNTVSAPAGIGAPVKMRIASPAASARAAARPAVRRPTIGKPGLALGVEIGVAHRVAVDRGIVERRQVERRDHVARQHPAARRGERHGLDLGDRRDALARSCRSISSTGSSGPENAKQSSVSCAISALRHAPAARSSGARVPQQHVGDAARYRRDRPPAPRPRQRRVGGDRDDVRDRPDAAAACRSAARWTSSLGWRSRLKPSTSTRSTGESLRSRSAASAPARRAARAAAPSAWPSRSAPRSRRPCGGMYESLPGWSRSKP